MKQVLHLANQVEFGRPHCDRLRLLGKLDDGLAEAIDVPHGLNDGIHEAVQLIRLVLVNQLEEHLFGIEADRWALVRLVLFDVVKGPSGHRNTRRCIRGGYAGYVRLQLSLIITAKSKMVNIILLE